MEHGIFMGRELCIGAEGAHDEEVCVERCNLVLDGEKWGVWGEMY